VDFTVVPVRNIQKDNAKGAKVIIPNVQLDIKLVKCGHAALRKDLILAPSVINMILLKIVNYIIHS
jgi:hypothetical protein